MVVDRAMLNQALSGLVRLKGGAEDPALRCTALAWPNGPESVA